jgi:hypothetical protein
MIKHWAVTCWLSCVRNSNSGTGSREPLRGNLQSLNPAVWSELEPPVGFQIFFFFILDMKFVSNSDRLSGWHICALVGVCAESRHQSRAENVINCGIVTMIGTETEQLAQIAAAARAKRLSLRFWMYEACLTIDSHTTHTIDGDQYR